LEGTVSVNNFATLDFVGDQTLASGTLIFAGNSGNLHYNRQLTLAPDVIIRGKSGTIRDNAVGAKLINQGIISTDVQAGQLNIIAAQFQNSGRIKASAPASLITIRSANFSNSGSTEELNGGKIQINP